MKLEDWLKSRKLSVNRFAKHHGFCKESLYRYLKGTVPRSNVARKIVKATGGEVSLEDLKLPESLIAKIRRGQQKMQEKLIREKEKRAAKKLANELNVKR